ncbi:MAG: hypothetical protein AAB441_01145 [Patescibacteria group bacterium]
MEPVSDNSNINSILKIAFVILLLVLIGELTYFFYIIPNKKPTTKVIPTFAPTKAPTPILITNKPVITLLPEYQGRITELDIFKAISSSEAKIKFSFKLEEVKIPSVFFFDKNELENLKVIDSTGKIISYKDLKVGQNIRFDLIRLIINVIE